jgi:hypothetical protein
MNQPFTNLMERYSHEAEAIKVHEARIERRRRITASILNNLRRLLALALLGTAGYYYKPIIHTMDVLTAKMFPAKPAISSAQQAKVDMVNQVSAAQAKAVADAMR